MKPILPIVAAALLAAACTDPKAAETNAPLPTDEDVQAIDAAAKQAAESVTEENADETLEDLEAELASGSED